MKSERICNVDGCDGKHYAKGFCNKHYHKYRWNNNPEYRKKMNERNKRYQKEHPEFTKKRNQKRYRRETCKIIYNHFHDPMIRTDPEALGAEFIAKICGVSCKKLEREKTGQ